MLQSAHLKDVESIAVNSKQGNWRSITFTKTDGTWFNLDVTGNTAALDALPKATNFVDLDLFAAE